MTNIQSVYTDGACLGNPGPGGWGVAIYFEDGTVHELGGAAPQTTNNRMELQGAIAALEFLQSQSLNDVVTLYTDSEYVKNGITRWIKGWQQKGWKTSQGKPVLNQDLWQQLHQLNQQLGQSVNWQTVRGHVGIEGNERCDAIARSFAQGTPPHLHQSEPCLEPEQKFGSPGTDRNSYIKIQSLSKYSKSQQKEFTGMETATPATEFNLVNATDLIDNLPREARVVQLRDLVETLHMADEIAEQGYLITSSELADLMDVNASAVTSRGDNWVWRNWIVSRVRREGNQILWQLERVENV